MRQMSKKVTATILAALRYWQDEITKHSSTAKGQRQAARGLMPHFAEIAPLLPAEIDDLCEDINSGVYWHAARPVGKRRHR
ncbi:MAG TPA: hypothetical protein VLM91_24560 [Candidatus Methylomirabilis sp.]|nr:hypothetical protein [Candidatus Methylomirabilis sp.]